jgi:hypothetical protein
MTTAYTTLLGLALPVQGELSGTWGDTVNDYITQYLDAAVAGAQTISGSQTAVTLSKTTNASLSQAGTGATGSSQYQIINCTGNPATLLTITAPAASKVYLILNNTSTNQSVKIVGTGPTTGVTVAAGRNALVAWNGSDFELVATTDAATLSGILPVANGGTGQSSLTANNVILGNGTSAVQFVAPGTSGNVLTSNGTTWTSAAAPSFTQVYPGAGIAVSTGTAWGTSKTSPTGNIVGTSDTQTLTNKTIAFASNTLTDVASTNTSQTFTGTKTFSGTTSTLAMVLNDAAEVATISATAATGTINYDITTQSVLYYTSNASANWTVNFRASSGTSLNTAMSTGQSVTVAFLVTQGATAYFNNAVQVDGSSVTPKYQGGTAWSAGNANSIDIYSYTIIKTGNAAFTVLASQTKFA